MLNQYTSRTVPGYVNVTGTATNTARVLVNTTLAERQGDYYRAEVPVANSGGPVWLGVTNVAVLTNASPNLVATVTGNVFVAKSPEVCGYDADGNMTNDGRWVLTWDAENRLKQVESRSDAPSLSRRKVTWEFDGQGRRIRQTTHDLSNGDVVTEDVKFVSDGWRHVAELNATNNALVRSYVWGLDLSGSQAGAGGVGGLLMLNSAANGAHFYCYDGNGNVAALVKASDGTVSANYEYEPFGKTLRATGLMADENAFGFSTKRTHRPTRLVLYEFRPYDADQGRWPSRDPIGEKGGKNIYAFAGNGPANNVDPDGRSIIAWPVIGKCCLVGLIVVGVDEIWCRSHIGGQFTLAEFQAERDTGTRHANEGSSADAVTHCIAACNLTREPGACICAARVRWYLTWRENGGRTAGNRVDLANNGVGFGYGSTAKSQEDCRKACLDAWNNGDLHTIIGDRVNGNVERRRPPFLPWDQPAEP